jgi:regulator of RNase E activity RraA
VIEPRRDSGLTARVLRWAMIELGTAGLSDRLGRAVLASSPPPCWLPAEAALAGPVVPLARTPASGDRPAPSSFAVLRDQVVPGAVVLVRSDPAAGAAFGSNLALQAAACGAQAIVTDGVWRDTGRLRRLALPVGGFGAIPAATSGRRYAPVEALDLFGATWRGGDWFLRDDDGVARLDDGAATRLAGELAAEFGGELTALVANS